MLFVAGAPELDGHDVGPHHPERAPRVPAALSGLEAAGVLDVVVNLEPRRATTEELGVVHSPAYVEAIRRFCEAGGGSLDSDTVAVSGSWDTALLAAGAGLAAVDALSAAGSGAAFVAARPPGHHATADRAMGFCLFNNVAVAAGALAARGERVLIVDWDVHHGNGTQDIFWDDPRVMYVSTHQWPLYPGTGALTDTGGPGDPGGTVNVPLPAGATGDVLLAAFDDVVSGAVERFAPTWVLVSAGYDAHRADPLAELELTAADYALLTSRVVQFAPGTGRVVVMLEGGYNLEALRMSVGATVSTLVGGDYRPEAPSSGGPGLEVVELVRRAHEEARAG